MAPAFLLQKMLPHMLKIIRLMPISEIPIPPLIQVRINVGLGEG